MLYWVIRGIPPKSGAWPWAKSLAASMRFMQWTLFWHAPPFFSRFELLTSVLPYLSCKPRLMPQCSLVGLMSSKLLNQSWTVISLPGIIQSHALYLNDLALCGLREQKQSGTVLKCINGQIFGEMVQFGKAQSTCRVKTHIFAPQKREKKKKRRLIRSFVYDFNLITFTKINWAGKCLLCTYKDSFHCCWKGSWLQSC